MLDFLRRHLFKLGVNLMGLHVVLILFYQEVVHAQEAATVNRPVLNELAVGGMVQGLLDMQIRPQGGFYEERYKEIFPDHINVASATNSDFDKRHTVSSSSKNIISEDGRLLADAAAGKRPNPCFDEERMERNPLLLLLCSLQLSALASVGNGID